jgi:hypothetical protein
VCGDDRAGWADGGRYGVDGTFELLNMRTKPKMSELAPLRDMMMPEDFYGGLDAGIRFAVRVLHAAGGIETCQSCQGGKGHSYDRPTIDMIATRDDAIGFRALAALADYGLPVADIAILWNVSNFLPYEKLWRITFTKVMEDRANEMPLFVHGYRAQR